MHRHSSVGRVDNFDSKPRNETGAFARAILGRAISRGNLLRPDGQAKRENLEHLAHYSPRHAQELRALKSNDAENRRQRDLLAWCAQVSTESEHRLSNILWEEAETRHDAARSDRAFRGLLEGEWDASKHPRGGYPENRGWFSPKGGGGAPKDDPANLDNFDFYDDAAAEAAVADGQRIPQPEYNYENPYLPSKKKGLWTGEKGNSAFLLREPIQLLDGRRIREIEFFDNAPLMDEFAYGRSPNLVLSGNYKLDAYNAKEAWKQLNPGLTIPEGYLFHHDMLRVTEEIVDLGDGKTQVVLVGQLQLIPKEINGIFHQGSASIARRLYKAMGIEFKRLGKFARMEVLSGGTKLVARLGRRLFKHNRVSASLRRFVGREVRQVVRVAVPGISAVLLLLQFKQEAQAHGVDGALVRATPVLGDFVAAVDLGTDIAREIRNEAEAKAGRKLAEMNVAAVAAGEKTVEQTMAAYRDLSSRIPVIRKPGGVSEDPVDIDAVAQALQTYQSQMYNANLLNEGSNAKDSDYEAKNFNYEATAAKAMRDLEEALIKAATEGDSEMPVPAT